MKAQALADHLAENPVDEEYEPLRTYFPDEEVMHTGELELPDEPSWNLFFDGAANAKGVGIGAILISEIGRHYPVTAQLRFYCTNNIAEYEACILGLRLDANMDVQDVLVLGDSDLLVHQIQACLLQRGRGEVDGEPWFYDIKEYLKMGIYPEQATGDQKRAIRRLANGFFLSGGLLY
ncbi:uncharacterized protein [Nicotiana sylvestris]|uniref:uncharacterized protein n=1 Tax=Nicotiana sylvestris TaxID=4096 RepID=UPI00388C9680